ncbi:MAG: 2-hydroxyacyl-CoA dehydratase family protein [Spirochaetota bacterium]|nr:2-hydroxyacyl-CoA dehydratase family protein [Spirochaetota bacterium]
MKIEYISRIQDENVKLRKQQFASFISQYGIQHNEASKYIESLFSKPLEKLTASQRRGRLLSELFIKSYNTMPDGSFKYHVVAWRSLFFPTEILYAMDIIPFTPEMTASQLAMSGIQIERVETAEQHNFSQDLCSFMRTAIGASIENMFPAPDIIVSSSHICDPSAKFGEYASIKYNRPEFILDVPYNIFGCSNPALKEEAIQYVTHQLKEMVQFLKENTGNDFDLEKFKECLQYSNEARKWLLRGNELIHSSNPSAYIGIKDLDYAANLMHTWGTKEIIDVYRLRYEEYLKSEPASEDKYRPPIHWYHLRPYYKNKLLQYIEERFRIVGSMVNYMYWSEMDISNPFRALAIKTLLHPAYCPVLLRAQITRSIICSGEGVIAYYPKSCRHFHSSARIESEYFRNACIPYLVIDGDCIDNRGDDFAVVQTRVDRFHKELLQQSKGKIA